MTEKYANAGGGKRGPPATGGEYFKHNTAPIIIKTFILHTNF
jgi:hypothetical protein